MRINLNQIGMNYKNNEIALKLISCFQNLRLNRVFEALFYYFGIASQSFNSVFIVFSFFLRCKFYFEVHLICLIYLSSYNFNNLFIQSTYFEFAI